MKKHRKASTLLSLAMIGGLGTTLGWSSTSHACAVEPYLSTVCLMALAGSQYASGFGGGVYLQAAGQIIPVNQNQALFSLIGNTYGGTYPNNFGLPDLRGRVVIGAGQYADAYGSTVYQIGAKGGDRIVPVPVPAHVHTLGNAKVQYSSGTLAGALDMSTVAFNTSLSGVTATTTLMGVTANTTLPAASVDGSAFTLYASSGGTLTNTPFNASLATVALPSKIYSNATPYVAMAAGTLGSIRGTAPVTYSGGATTTLSGSPTTALTGNPTTTLTGTPKVTIGGTPTLTVVGGTDVAGISGAAISNMQPYVAMFYFIAVKNAVYPTPDN